MVIYHGRIRKKKSPKNKIQVFLADFFQVSCNELKGNGIKEDDQGITRTPK